jgi:uncharacterized membrane protein
MAHGPTELMIWVFDDASKADQALQELKELKHEKLIKIEDAAVLTRTADGKARVKEIHDLGGGKGALLGAIGGALVSLVVGPLGLIGMTAAGAVVGGLAAHFIDRGFSNEQLKQIRDQLAPNTSAIIAVIEHRWVKDLINTIAQTEIASLGQQYSVTLGGDLPTITEQFRKAAAEAEAEAKRGNESTTSESTMPGQ